MSQKVTRALLSVSDKTGLVPFAQALAEQGIELISTGGTASTLREAGLDVLDVSDVTQFPEMMDGRVKTLHPKIHGGLLGVRDSEIHQQTMQKHGITPIDLLVVSLYPFEETVARGADYDEVIENIDIGGPAMIRSAAKNHASVCVLTDSDDYDRVITDLLDHNGTISLHLRKEMAAKAFTRTAAYDAAISSWFTRHTQQETRKFWAGGGALKQTLRYGENPHQSAAFYASPLSQSGIAYAIQHQGKELSYNNINDTDAAFALVSEFKQDSVVIVKHANPCGVASAVSLPLAFEQALACDPISAFGGIIAVNKIITKELVETIGKLFMEVLIGPDIEPAALELLSVKKNCRVLTTETMLNTTAKDFNAKTINGGWLVQDLDNVSVSKEDMRVVTDRAPTEAELDDLLFSFRVCKHVKSNAIVFGKDAATMGIGAGQMSRIDSVRIAQWKAQEAGLSTEGSVLASDAFFPFDDNVHHAAKAGVTAVIQPGGSVRDEEVIKAANEHGMAMVFSGIRHFRH